MAGKDRYKKITFWKQAVDELLVSVFLESHEKAPEQIILDIDTTDLPLHGKQEGRFFHGYYDSYCYLPLYIFCGEHVLCARLRQSNSDASAGSLAEIERIVEPNSSGVAGGEDHLAWRLRLLPERADELVRRPRRGLCVRAGAEPAAAKHHRAPDVGSDRAVEPDRQAGARVRRVRLSDPEKRRTAAGVGSDAWWPKPSISMAKRIRASW